MNGRIHVADPLNSPPSWLEVTGIRCQDVRFHASMMAAFLGLHTPGLYTPGLHTPCIPALLSFRVAYLYDGCILRQEHV